MIITYVQCHGIDQLDYMTYILGHIGEYMECIALTLLIIETEEKLC